MPRKGTSNNPAGRPRGTQNKATKELKDHLKTLLDGNMEKFKTEMEELSGAAFVKLYLSVLKYALPTKYVEGVFKEPMPTINIVPAPTAYMTPEARIEYLKDVEKCKKF